MFLLDQVVAWVRGDDLLMIDIDQARNLLYRGSITAELTGMDHLWDAVFPQLVDQEALYRLSVPVPLKQNVEHEPVLVHSTP